MTAEGDIATSTSFEKVTREVAAKIPFLEIVGLLNIFFIEYVRPYIVPNINLSNYTGMWVNPISSSSSKIQASLIIYTLIYS